MNDGVRQTDWSFRLHARDSVMDEVDAQVYLDSLPRQRVRSECLRYLLSPAAISNDKVRRVFQQELHRHRERQAAQQAQQRAALQGPGPLGAPPFGSLAVPRGYIYDPTSPIILYDDPPLDWSRWIVALKILGCVAIPPLWWWYCTVV